MAWSDAARRAAAEVRRYHSAGRKEAKTNLVHGYASVGPHVATPAVRKSYAKKLRAMRAGTMKVDSVQARFAGASTVMRNYQSYLRRSR